MSVPRGAKRLMPPRPEVPDPVRLGSSTIKFNVEPDGKGKWRYYYHNPWIEPGEPVKIKSLNPAEIVALAKAKLARMANRQDESSDPEVARLRLEITKLQQELQTLKEGPVKQLAELEALPKPAQLSLKQFVTDASAAQQNLPPGMTLTDAATDVKRSRRYFTPTKTTVVIKKFVEDREGKNRHRETIRKVLRIGEKLEQQNPGKDFHELWKLEYRKALDALHEERSDKTKNEKPGRTSRNDYDALRTLNRFAYMIDAIPADQVLSIKKLERPTIDKPNPGPIYPVPTLKGILAVCETPRQVARVVIPAFGGPRACELLGIGKFQFVPDGQGRIIGIGIGPEEAKGYDEITTARVFPIRRTLSVWLSRLKDTDAWFVLQDERDTVQKQLSERLKEHGITWLRNGLRRSNESYSVALTGNAAHIAAANGHGTRIQRDNYLITYVQFQDGCEWFRTLPADVTPDEKAWVEEEIKAFAVAQNASYMPPQPLVSASFC